jgi:hypothetical protein
MCLAVFLTYSLLLLSSITVCLCLAFLWHHRKIDDTNVWFDISICFLSIYSSIYSIPLNVQQHCLSRWATSCEFFEPPDALCVSLSAVQFVGVQRKKVQWGPFLCVWCSCASVKGLMALQFGWDDAVTTQVLRAIFGYRIPMLCFFDLCLFSLSGCKAFVLFFAVFSLNVMRAIHGVCTEAVHCQWKMSVLLLHMLFFRKMSVAPT